MMGARDCAPVSSPAGAIGSRQPLTTLSEPLLASHTLCNVKLDSNRALCKTNSIRSSDLDIKYVCNVPLLSVPVVRLAKTCRIHLLYGFSMHLQATTCCSNSIREQNAFACHASQDCQRSDFPKWQSLAHYQAIERWVARLGRESTCAPSVRYHFALLLPRKQASEPEICSIQRLEILARPPSASWSLGRASSPATTNAFGSLADVQSEVGPTDRTVQVCRCEKLLLVDMPRSDLDFHRVENVDELSVCRSAVVDCISPGRLDLQAVKDDTAV